MKRKLIGILICMLLMLVATPTIVGNDIKFSNECSTTTLVDDDIEYPKENGPYKFFLSGYFLGDILPPFLIEEGKIIIGFFRFFTYPNKVYFWLPPQYKRVIFIDGQNQKDVMDNWEKIEIFGFRGIYADYIDFHVAIGSCDEIDIIWYG